MGAGLARDLCQLYPQLKSTQYTRRRLGSVFDVETQPHIISMVTKPLSAVPAADMGDEAYEWLRKGLAQAIEIARSKGFKQLDIPYLIGCGLDKLNEKKVKLMCREVAKRNRFPIVAWSLNHGKYTSRSDDESVVEEEDSLSKALNENINADQVELEENLTPLQKETMVEIDKIQANKRKWKWFCTGNPDLKVWVWTWYFAQIAFTAYGFSLLRIETFIVVIAGFFITQFLERMFNPKFKKGKSLPGKEELHLEKIELKQIADSLVDELSWVVYGTYRTPGTIMNAKGQAKAWMKKNYPNLPSADAREIMEYAIPKIIAITPAEKALLYELWSNSSGIKRIFSWVTKGTIIEHVWWFWACKEELPTK